ncbi:MAG: DUF3576 domain-containing protein [Hellea sp.]|nr:DUF3576 domain-containing protein [Hellea sp.]
MSKSTIRAGKLLLAATLSAALLSGCGIIGGGKKAATTKTVKTAPSMGVNSYLWRASLETLNFMPLDQVDPFGGVIVTDWYASPEVPTERFKANVYILDTNLRADALKTSIFKQTRSGSDWIDAPMDADTGRLIENAILTRARELYIATVDAR